MLVSRIDDRVLHDGRERWQGRGGSNQPAIALKGGLRAQVSEHSSPSLKVAPYLVESPRNFCSGTGTLDPFRLAHKCWLNVGSASVGIAQKGRLTKFVTDELKRILGAVAMTLALFGIVALQGCGTLYATAKNPRGDDVMLLGYDPVAYFTERRPLRGVNTITATLPGRTYYFASARHKQMFEADPARYEPQYGGFCSDGAAFGIKLSTDPNEFEIVDDRLFIFGDVIGHEMWKLDPRWNIAHADRLWPEARDVGHRWQSLKRYVFKVTHYLTSRELMDEWKRRNPGKELTYDPGGMLKNLFVKQPGWRAAEGFGQPALGYPD